jgi:hypothetical protein
MLHSNHITHCPPAGDKLPDQAEALQLEDSRNLQSILKKDLIFNKLVFAFLMFEQSTVVRA